MQSHKNSPLNTLAFFCSSIAFLLEDKSEGIAGKGREIIYESMLKIAEGISVGGLPV